MRRLFNLLFVFSLAIPASATVVLRYTLDQVRDRADVIFTGRVVSSSLVPVMEGRLRAMVYVIEVDDLLQGAVGSTTTVAFVNAGYNGSPSLQIGERYLFFKTGPQNNTTVGWGQGVYHIETVGNQTILISGDGEPLVLADGKLARGAKVRVAGGMLVREAAEAMTSDPPDKLGAAFNADGSLAPRVRTAPAVAKSQSPVFATVNDVKHFVAAGHGTRVRQETP